MDNIGNTCIEYYKNTSLEDIPGEVWRPVKRFSSGVLCSNMGRIKTIHSLHPSNVRIMKQMIRPEGYCFVQVEKNKKRHTFNVHREVAKSFIPNPNNYPEVNHVEGNKKDNRAEKLEWCTRKQNIRHASDVLDVNGGLKHFRSKFSKEDVLKIYHSNGTDRDVAKEYGVSHAVIGFIRSKKSYKSILKNEPTKGRIFNSRKRLTEDIVKHIYTSLDTHTDCAKKYSIKVLTIWLIRAGKKYSNITSGLNAPIRNTTGLSHQDISYIKNCGLPTKELMKKFSVSKSFINKLKRA